MQSIELKMENRISVPKKHLKRSERTSNSPEKYQGHLCDQLYTERRQEQRVL